VATPELLARTRPWSVTATALLGLWLSGNLYEEVVWIPRLIADPRPGTLVNALALGSPVYFYLPWAPISLALVVALRVRFGGEDAGARRAWNRTTAALAVALAVKVALITGVNPVFRDPAATTDLVHDRAVLWAFGNGAAIVAVALALTHLTAWRRP